MKPQDFLIGLRDFFAVVVPGAIFLFCLLAKYLTGLAPVDGTLRLFAGAVAAYVIGSVASAAGSQLDKLVDPVLESELTRRLWKKLGRREALARELKVRMIETLPEKERGLHPEDVKDFWWGHLSLCCVAAIAELDRIEAAQKLFRSLVPIFAGLAFWSWRNPRLGWPGGAGAEAFAVGAGLALFLYVAGRAEFLSTVYRYAGAFSVAERAKSRPAG